MSSSRRLSAAPVRLVLGAVLCATALPPGASAAPAAPTCPPRVTTTADGWRRMAAPPFGAGPTSVTAYAVTPDAESMFVTNGVVVARSADGGCAWTPSFTVPETASAEFPFTRETATIVDVVAGERWAYLVLRDALGPRILVSEDGGRSWVTAATPAVHADLVRNEPRLTVDRSGRNAYLLVRPSPGLFLPTAGDVLLATANGGETWAVRPIDVGATGVNAQVNDVAVDPVSGASVWASTTSGVLHSEDGGGTWTALTPNATGWLGSIAVTHRDGEAVQVVVASEAEPVVYVTKAGGGWTTINTPGAVTSATGGRTVAQVAITTASGTYELAPSSLTWRPVHTGGPALSRLGTDYTDAPTFYACACDTPDGAVWSRAPRAATGDRGADDDRGVDNPAGGDFPGYFGCAPDPKRRQDPAQFGPSVVAPGAHEVNLAPGQSLTVPYTFRVQPRRLDVYFLLDTGPRSDRFGCAAKQGMVWAAEEVAASRNLRVGVGQYRDFARAENALGLAGYCLSQLRTDFVYRRDLRIGAVDASFRQAVAAVSGNACTGDFAGLTALLQSATGAGFDSPPAGTSPYDIRRGQQAGFGADAYRVILHVAGGWFDTPTRTPRYPGVDFEAAINALNDHDIRQVGIHVPPDRKKKHHSGEPVNNQETGAEDIRRVALATNAVASRRVDCGGRLKAVVRPTDPLVCDYVAEEFTGLPGRPGLTAPPMGRQMADLLRAIADPQPMRVSVLSGDAVVAGVKGSARVLDHLLPQTLSYTVTYRCDADAVGTVNDVRVGGTVGSSIVAAATTTVRCGAPPAAPRFQAPPNFAATVPVIQVAAPAPAANPAPNTNPATNPASQAQAQGQNVPQGAVVPEERSEVQLAYATDGDSGDQQLVVEYQMSALPERRDAEVPAWALAGAAGFAACAAASLAGRRAGAAAWARQRR